MTGVPRVVNSRKTNSVTYINIQHHQQNYKQAQWAYAEKRPSFQTYQVMLVETGYKVILEVSN